MFYYWHFLKFFTLPIPIPHLHRLSRSFVASSIKYFIFDCIVEVIFLTLNFWPEHKLHFGMEPCSANYNSEVLVNNTYLACTRLSIGLLTSFNMHWLAIFPASYVVMQLNKCASIDEYFGRSWEICLNCYSPTVTLFSRQAK